MSKQKASRDDSGRFLPGRSGNPKGRPPGNRNWAPLLVEALLDGQAEALARKLMKMALDGDVLAMRLCMERLMPPRRERHMTLPLPPLTTADNIAAGFGNLAGAVTNGDVTPAETTSATLLLEGAIRAVEMTDVVRRIEELEKRVGGNDE